MDLKFKDNSKLKLGITQLEYIESTGTQYIDTGIKVNNNSRIVCKFNDLNSNPAFIFGSRNNSSKGQFGYINGTSGGQGARYGSTEIALAVTHNIDLELDANKNVWTLGSNTITINSQTFQGNYNIYIFAINSAGTVTIGNATRFYYFKVYNNDTLVIDLIPCITDNGTPGMYDTVSRTFFYNQGSGDFVAGPVVAIGLPNNILLKTTTLYHKNTPNINGLQLLNAILNTQETAENVVLNRIRVDIGNVSGSLTELMQYASMAGFNDNYEFQAKPRLVGTWTVNDWCTQEQLTTAQTAFDGLTIVGDPNYVIDFNDLAVQTLDSTKPNYNPAVAIVLKAQSLGVTLDEPVVEGQTGRWFITKTDAATKSIPLNIFNSSTVTDTNHIVTETAEVYNVTSFYEFRHFGGYKDGNTYQVYGSGSALKAVWYSPYVTAFRTWTFYNSQIQYVFYDNYDLGGVLERDNYVTHYFGIGKNIYSDVELMHCNMDKNKKFSSSPGNKKTVFDDIIPTISVNNNIVTLSYQERYFKYFYTVDGTNPTINSQEYTEPFNWDGVNPIKIIICNNNTIYFSTEYYAETTSDPTITYNNGIAVISGENNSDIYYTTDGSCPSNQSNKYNNPIVISSDTKLRCIAYKSGKNNSKVVSKWIILDNSRLNNIAIQSINSSLPHYNPAVCMALCRVMTIPNTYFCYGSGVFMTTTEAQGITTLHKGTFNQNQDIYGINSNSLNSTYNLTSFSELSSFGITEIPTSCFEGCSYLQTIDLTNITSIGPDSFYGCSNLELSQLPTGLTHYGYCSFAGCAKVSFTDIPSGITSLNTNEERNKTYDGSGYITACLSVGITFHNITSIYIDAPWSYFCPRFTGYLHFEQNFLPDLNSTNMFKSYSGTIYWGSGVSQSDDEAILALVTNDSIWRTYAHHDTWYNYLHSTT